jgi:4-hydroxy-tetrahydrodipicolinate synthase
VAELNALDQDRSLSPRLLSDRASSVISPATATTWLTGYIPDLPTPLDNADRIDLRALERLCERQIAAGASALAVCETAGEASTLSTAEWDTIIRVAVGIAKGRARIIAGAGSNSTSRAIELTRHAKAAGADAVLSVVPYYNKPMQNGLYAHFRAVANAAELPVILHDIPARTVRELADDTLLRLAESRQFIGLRDGSGDVTRPMRLRSLLPQSFRLLSGHDATALAYLAAGGDGAISMVSNVTPDLCQTVFSNLKHGRLQTARYLQKRLIPLDASLANESPAALKYALSLLGFMFPNTRLPIVPLDEPAKAAVANAIAGLDEDLASAAEA